MCRMVCQALVNSDSLEWERTQLWALTFRLFRKIIGGVDYKVRTLVYAFLATFSAFFLSLFSQVGSTAF